MPHNVKYSRVPLNEGDEERAEPSEEIKIKRTDENDLVNQRMPYCIGFVALMAILYVLSRTENGMDTSCEPADFDIGDYRAKQLAATPPHIIECAEAGEGGSQEKCHLSRPKRYTALNQKGITLWMTGLSGAGILNMSKH